MPLRYVLDENLRGPMWQAVKDHNRTGSYLLNVVRVGDVSELKLGTVDPDLLIWAENENRILVSEDRRTLPFHLRDHLSEGKHCPGIFIVRDQCSLPDVISFLEAAAYASDPSEWEERIEYIP